ncbi:MAG: uroporphyrinogen-III synthase [Psychromonas sp.]
MHKPKPRLLVTRFAPHAQRLTDLLNINGVVAFAQPLLQVRKTAEFDYAKRIFSNNYDLVIAVSQNAVDYTNQALAGGFWPISAYYAVGKGTQTKLSVASGQDVFIPDQRFASEGLLAMSQLSDLKDKKILILRGKGGRELLKEKLTERGASVDYYQPYQRITVDLDGSHEVEKWQVKNINGVIISSNELLQRLLEVVPKSELGWLKKLTIYAPSKRITDRAELLGWTSCRVLPGISDQQVVDYFK